jgi:hypothetical protein
MEFFQNNKKIFLFVGIFIGLFLIYKFFIADNGSTDPNAAPVSALTTSSEGVVGRELINTLAELQVISLDFSIFDNPVFTSLDDKSYPIEPQPLGKTYGRNNPFLDFGGSFGSSTVSSNANLPATAFGNSNKTTKSK